MQDIHAIGTVANRLGVPRWRLAYLIEKKYVPGPSFTVSGRRLFTDDDVERIAVALDQREKNKKRVFDAGDPARSACAETSIC